jgi:hypothetical protein
MIFEKGDKTHDGEEEPSSTDVAGKSGDPHVEE